MSQVQNKETPQERFQNDIKTAYTNLAATDADMAIEQLWKMYGAKYWEKDRYNFNVKQEDTSSFHAVAEIVFDAIPKMSKPESLEKTIHTLDWIFRNCYYSSCSRKELSRILGPAEKVIDAGINMKTPEMLEKAIQANNWVVKNPGYQSFVGRTRERMMESGLALNSEAGISICCNELSHLATTDKKLDIIDKAIALKSAPALKDVFSLWNKSIKVEYTDLKEIRKHHGNEQSRRYSKQHKTSQHYGLKIVNAAIKLKSPEGIVLAESALREVSAETENGKKQDRLLTKTSPGILAYALELKSAEGVAVAERVLNLVTEKMQDSPDKDQLITLNSFKLVGCAMGLQSGKGLITSVRAMENLYNKTSGDEHREALAQLDVIADGAALIFETINSKREAREAFNETVQSMQWLGPIYKEPKSETEKQYVDNFIEKFTVLRDRYAPLDQQPA